MAIDNNDFTHEFQIYTTDLNAGTMGTGKFLLFDNNINAVKIENIDNIKIGGGSNGKILATDGEGNLRWVSAASGGGASSYNDLTDLPALFSGNYNDLTNKPTLFTANQALNTGNSVSFNRLTVTGATGIEGGEIQLAKAPTSTLAGDVIIDVYDNKIRFFEGGGTGRGFYLDLTTGANNTNTNIMSDSFSGSYNDLTNKPTVATSAYIGTTEVAFNRASGALTLAGVSIDGNAATVSNGVYTSGSYANPAWITSLAYSKLTDAPSIFSGAYADLTGKPSLATVATSGSYSDLTNRPTIFSGDYADLANKPVLFDGAYLSLTGLPNLAAVATSGSYNDLSNKPSIPSLDGYATEAWVNSQGFGSGSGSGVTSYNDLTDKPSIPTVPNDVSAFNNDSGYITLSDIPTPTMINSGNTAPGSAVVANETNVSVNFSDGGSGKFVFKANGQLQLASGGDIVDSTGASVLGGGGTTLPANASGYLTNDGSGNLAWAAGDGTFSGDYNDLTNKPTYRQTVSAGSGPGGNNQSDSLVLAGLNPVTDIPSTWGGDLILQGGVGGANGDLYGEVRIKSGTIGSNYEWHFTSDKKIKLPAGGDIVDSTGTSVLGGGGGATALSGLSDVAIEGPIEGSVLTWNNSQNHWENRSIPVATQIANTDGISTYSVSVGTDGVVTMTTARGGLEFGALPEPGGPSHFHIMRPAGENGSGGTDLYFGDDYNYVLQRPASYNDSPAYGVEIGANDNDGGDQQVWRFGTDGTLTLPTSGTIVATESIVLSTNNAGSPFDWTFDGTGKLQIPSGGDIVDSTGTSVLGGGSSDKLVSGDLELVFNDSGTLTFPGPGGGSDVSVDQDTGVFEISTPGDIVLHNTHGDWTFDSNGDLKLPAGGDIVDSTGASVLGGGGSGGSLDPYVTIVDSKVSVTADIDFPAADVAGAIASVSGNFDFGVYFQEATGDAEGNMYAVGHTNESNDYAIVYAFNPNGSVKWKTSITISGNTQTPDLHNIKLKSDYLYVGFTYYDNDDSSEYHGVAKLVADTGAMNDDWIIKTPQNTYPNIHDIAIKSNGTPIMVGTYGNGLDTLNNVPTQAGGSVNSVIFNNSDLEGFTSQSGYGGQWQVETAPGTFSYPDYINHAYVPATNVSNPSATGMIVAFRYDQNQSNYWAGYVIADPNGGYTVNDQMKVSGSLMYGIDGNTTLTQNYVSVTADGSTPITVYFSMTAYPDLFEQLVSCDWTAAVDGSGTYAITSTSVVGDNIMVVIDTTTAPTSPSGVSFYTANGNDAIWLYNGGVLNGLSGRPSEALKAKTWFSWNSPGPNVDFTSVTTVNLKAYLSNQAFIWTPSWNFTYGNSESEYFYGVAYDAADDKIYAVGNFWGNNNGTYHDGALFKIDGSNGSVIWSKFVEDNTGPTDNLMSVMVDSNGDIITVGDNDDGYALVTKLDAGGTVIWQARQTNNNNWSNEPRGAIDSDGNVYLTGVWSDGNNYVSMMKLNGNDGTLAWARKFNNSEGEDFFEFEDEDSQTTTVAGTNLYYGGLCYDINNDEYVAVAVRLPIDGTGTGTYGRWVYSEDTDAQWEDSTSDAELYTATYPALAFDGQSLHQELANSNADSVGSATATAYALGGTGHNITNVSGITFSDGSTQTTAAVNNPPILWTNGNGNQWRIETYNGGYNGTYDGGDTDALWFNAQNAPSGDSNFRGAIIEYHAYFNGAGTMVGTIQWSRDNNAGDFVTHTEHMSGNSEMPQMDLWFTNGNDRRLYFKRLDGSSQNIMIQWTAKIFYGSESYC